MPWDGRNRRIWNSEGLTGVMWLCMREHCGRSRHGKSSSAMLPCGLRHTQGSIAWRGRVIRRLPRFTLPDDHIATGGMGKRGVVGMYNSIRRRHVAAADKIAR